MPTPRPPNKTAKQDSLGSLGFGCSVSEIWDTLSRSFFYYLGLYMNEAALRFVNPHLSTCLRLKTVSESQVFWDMQFTVSAGVWGLGFRV